MGFFDFLKPVEHAGGSALKFLDRNVVRPVIHDAKNAGDVLNAGRQGVQGLLDIGKESIFGTDKSYEDAINRTDKATRYSLGASRGAYTYDEATSDDIGKSFLKPLARNAVTYAPYFALGGVGGAAADTIGATSKLGRLAASSVANFGVNTGVGVAGQAAEGQPIDLKSAATGALAATALNTGIEGVHMAKAGIKPVFADGNIPGKVPNEILVKLSKATKGSEVKQILAEGLPADVADRIAPAVAHAKDVNAIQNIVDRALPELPNAGASIPKEPNVVIPPAPEPELLAHIADPAGTRNLPPAPVDLPSATVPTSGESVLGNAALKTAAADSKPLPTPGADPVQEIIGHLKEATSTRAKQEAGYSAERSQRLAASQAAGAELPGLEGHKAELGALKGELGKQEYTGLRDKLDPAQQDDYFTQLRQAIKESPAISGYNKINAAEAARKIIYGDGGVPTNSEIGLLRKAFGDDFAETIKQDMNQTFAEKAKALGSQILGAPKALLASYDLSGGFRQGAVLGARFPKEFAEASKEQLKYFASTDAFENAMHEIGSRPNAELYHKAGLDLTGLGTKNEEAYISQLAERIPGIGRGVAASDRAYTGLLTKLRADSFDHIMNDLKETGIDPTSLSSKDLTNIGKFLNTASGRGSGAAGGLFEKSASTLGQALFSPRLWKSRLDMLNPIYYAKLSGPARKYALQAAGSYAAIAGTVLGLATLAGADVETDARSSDFGKIKVGNTRYDILGGFQQNLVAAHRIIFSGEKKSSTTGAITKLGTKFGGADRLSVLSDFVQNKENPVISTGSTILKGKDKAGNPVDPASEIGKLFVPLNVQDTYKTYKDTGSVPESLVKATVPGTLGVGVGTYGIKDTPLSERQRATIQVLKEKGASPEKQKAYASFYQTLQGASGKRTNVSDAINEALKNGDTAKAQKLAKDYNKEYAAAFKEWAANNKQHSDKTLTKEYNSNKINLTSASIKTRVKAIKANPINQVKGS